MAKVLGQTLAIMVFKTFMYRIKSKCILKHKNAKHSQERKITQFKFSRVQEVRPTTAHGVYIPCHAPDQWKWILQSRTVHVVQFKWTRDPICCFFSVTISSRRTTRCAVISRVPSIIFATRYILLRRRFVVSRNKCGLNE